MERPEEGFRCAKPGRRPKLFDRKADLFVCYTLRCRRLGDQPRRGELASSYSRFAMLGLMFMLVVFDTDVMVMVVIGDQEERMRVRHLRPTLAD